MENATVFPSDPEFSVNSYQIFKQIRSVENLSFNASFTLTVLYTNGGKIYIIDNITRAIIVVVDFAELLAESRKLGKIAIPIFGENAEKDKGKLVDAVEFCKNNRFIFVASIKLAHIFLIRVEHNTLDTAEQGRPRIVLATPLPAESTKNKVLRLSPDPYSKYNVCVSGYSPCVINFKQGNPSFFKPYFAKLKDQAMEVEPESLKDTENSYTNLKDSIGGELLQDESDYAFISFLDRYSNKKSKEAIAVLRNYVLVLKFTYHKSTRDFSDFTIVTRLAASCNYQLQNVQLSPSNKYVALKLHKKSIKIFKYSEGVITAATEFESNEGRNWQDFTFSTFKSSEGIYEDWIVISEKNSISSSVNWCNLNTGYIRNERMNSASISNIKRLYCNLFWNCSLVALDGSTLIVIEIKRPQNWIALGFRFKYLPENQEYIEKENEFDKLVEDPATSKISLTTSTFLELTPDKLFSKRNVSENYKFFLAPVLNLVDDRIETKIENIESYSMKEEEQISKLNNAERKDKGSQLEMVVEKEKEMGSESREDEERKLEEVGPKHQQESLPDGQLRLDNENHEHIQQMFSENGDKMQIEKHEYQP